MLQISFKRTNNLLCNLYINDVRLEQVNKLKLLRIEVKDDNII